MTSMIRSHVESGVDGSGTSVNFLLFGAIANCQCNCAMDSLWSTPHQFFLLNSCQCQTSYYIASTNRIWLKKAVGLCHMSHLPKCRALADQGSKYSRVSLSGAMWAAMLMIDSTMQSLNYMPVNRTPGALFASWIALIETYTHIYYICMEICDFPTF